MAQRFSFLLTKKIMIFYSKYGNFDKYLFFGRNINNNAGIKFKVKNIKMIGIIISFFEEALFIFLSV